jgi:hypothetical protein
MARGVEIVYGLQAKDFIVIVEVRLIMEGGFLSANAPCD